MDFEVEELLRKHLSYDRRTLDVMLDVSVPVVEQARLIHDRWCRSAVNGGWEYGLSRDPDRRRDPRLRPFDQLSEVEQAEFYDIASEMRDASSMN